MQTLPSVNSVASSHVICGFGDSIRPGERGVLFGGCGESGWHWLVSWLSRVEASPSALSFANKHLNGGRGANPESSSLGRLLAEGRGGTSAHPFQAENVSRRRPLVRRCVACASLAELTRGVRRPVWLSPSVARRRLVRADAASSARFVALWNVCLCDDSRGPRSSNFIHVSLRVRRSILGGATHTRNGWRQSA